MIFPVSYPSHFFNVVQDYVHAAHLTKMDFYINYSYFFSFHFTADVMPHFMEKIGLLCSFHPVMTEVMEVTKYM